MPTSEQRSNAKKAAPKFYVVPAGQRSAQCSGPNCKAVIYWVRNPQTGRMLPVDCDVEGGEAPSEQENRGQRDLFGGFAEVHDGLGVSHFETCADADRFSGRGRRDD